MASLNKKLRRRSHWWTSLAAGLIVIIISAAVVFPRGKKPEQESDLENTARAYAQAIADFQRDHARPPLLVERDWPNYLSGPVDDNGTPYLKAIPEFVRDHRFQVVQRADRGSAPVNGYYIVYIPYGRSFSFKAGYFVYKGYLLLTEMPYGDSLSLPTCEAWSDPVQVACGDDLRNR